VLFSGHAVSEVMVGGHCRGCTLCSLLLPSRPSPCRRRSRRSTYHPWFHVCRLEVHSRFPTIEAPDKVAEAIVRFVTQEVAG
jgi:hypothetical protein